MITRRRWLAGAALDVFEEEPLPVGHPVTQAPATLLSPHVGGMTEEALQTQMDRSVPSPQ